MTEHPCPFCDPDPARVFYRGANVFGVWDAYPVSEGHALLVTTRHVASWFDATREEHIELASALTIAREAILAKHHPDGFNIGVNIGKTAGQTVPHLHVHLIPRYSQDVQDPRGGVRHVIPSRANYLKPESSSVDNTADRVADAGPETLQTPRSTKADSPLVTGADDPLLPYLLSHLDHAQQADLLASFILESGVAELESRLRERLDRNAHVRILVGDYLGITEPNALLRLLDLQQGTEGILDVRVFESRGKSFHPKAYIFHGAFPNFGKGVAYVGSSNLSRSALTDAVEWNYRIVPAGNDSGQNAGFTTVVREFERLFTHPQTTPLTPDWIARYRARRPAERQAPVGVPPEPPRAVPEPHAIQQEALEALEQTRSERNAAGLVVLATGLGKTWLAAFDTDRFRAKRVLFVAHREEILRQALDTFRRIRPEATLGLYTGTEKDPTADVLFASIQTLGKKPTSETSARTPSTTSSSTSSTTPPPARTVNSSTTSSPNFSSASPPPPSAPTAAICSHYAERTSSTAATSSKASSASASHPFATSALPMRSTTQTSRGGVAASTRRALTNAIATQERAANVFDQYRKTASERTLAFCCSHRHADFMAEYFGEHGVASAAVHSGPNSAPRAQSLEKLRAGQLDVIFSVDMFNEGADIPALDTVMMLRPTESRILWLQQFGRGLRLAEGKDHLTVVDYIGNHRTFLLKPQTLLGLDKGDREIALALEQLEKGAFELPPGCEVTYELEAVNILRALLRTPKEPEALRTWYESFRERHETRPTAVVYHFNP